MGAPVAVGEIVAQHLLRGLCLADAVAEQEMRLVLGAINGIEGHAATAVREDLAKLLALPAADNGLKLLKVRHDNHVRNMRLLAHALEEPVPFPIVVLTGLVDKDQIDLAQSGGRSV